MVRKKATGGQNWEKEWRRRQVCRKHGAMVIRIKKISYRAGPFGSSYQGQYERVQDILLMTELLLRRREMLA